MKTHMLESRPLLLQSAAVARAGYRPTRPGAFRRRQSGAGTAANGQAYAGDRAWPWRASGGVPGQRRHDSCDARSPARPRASRPRSALTTPGYRPGPRPRPGAGKVLLRTPVGQNAACNRASYHKKILMSATEGRAGRSGRAGPAGPGRLRTGMRRDGGGGGDEDRAGPVGPRAAHRITKKSATDIKI